MDPSGSMYGITVYETNQTAPRSYNFVYNAQGDVIGLYSYITGSVVATYDYDAWGNCTVKALIADDNGHAVTDLNHIANLNPFRYRGYYYDTETGLYYLNSRYYDPQTGRFINADGLLGANGDLISYNLFTYCSNNPVMGYDPSGCGWWEDLLRIFMTEDQRRQQDNIKYGTPIYGEPNSWLHIPSKAGDNDIDRYFGPDGKADYDIHWGHSHHHPGVGSPHREDWNWGDPKRPQLDPGTAKPYDPARDGTPPGAPVPPPVTEFRLPEIQFNPFTGDNSFSAKIMDIVDGIKSFFKKIF